MAQLTQECKGEGLNPIAHARPTTDGNWATPHLLEDHLLDVARLAAASSAAFANADWGYLAGLWHDLGKYKADFQNYIRNVSGFEADEADEGGPGKVDHTAAGAIHAIKKLGPHGRFLAYLIAGHHSGLPDWLKLSTEVSGRSLSERLADEQHLEQTLREEPPVAILEGRAATSLPCGTGMKDGEHMHLWLRMLFSCLVDADFLDTEAYMNPEEGKLRVEARGPSIIELEARFQRYMLELSTGVQASPINELRRQILNECLEGAAQVPGFFSLTVPTGGGKTLASVGFALRHAITHGKSRVIVVIPYTSIIEQTAEVLRRVFGDNTVLEHHCNLDPDRETRRTKLSAENWDAPIIVTTNVQFFESLFAARTSACRKLHHIVNAVVVFDEAQMLPPEFLRPILSVLQGLVAHFGVSALLCTATQPALEGHIGARAQGEDGGFEGLQGVRELMSDPLSLATALKRVQLTTRSLERPAAWADIAEELETEAQVLCIVNTRRDCRELHALLPPGSIHLSGLMCGEHRSAVVAHIKLLLKEEKPIRVVSTQLVEAGVDIDFPVVYRAIAGLDSIAQAAGRCNREGLLPGGRLGRVVVFSPPRAAPLGLLRFGEDATRAMMVSSPTLALSLSPEAYTAYFKRFYDSVHSFDEKGIRKLLVPGAREAKFWFRTAAAQFKLVDDKGQRAILVWFERSVGGRVVSSQRLIEQVRHVGPRRSLMRRLQRFSVNVPEPVWLQFIEMGAIEELSGPDGPLGLWAQAVPGLYDHEFGLRLDGPEVNGDEFIC